ncbi:hypothetical protein GUA87_08785 [Sneathiella sp. P13V-1]|uniref:hypothetical protein n=1 Tax=Sneathiella sp. P13V-1 TaxID=2697366 RepID=UPI00187B802E|nr:hypothetical protein [Sneathiella sp. P13V-1]MBE7636938.1 hypothetical protein [Sneathiella sp. P13V-1]
MKRCVFAFTVSLVISLVTGCKTGINYVKAERSDVFNKAYEEYVGKLHNIEIDNPTLSFDGRFMAFDFRQLLISKEGPGTHTNLVGIYDFQTRKYQIVAPYGEKIGFHSPSFNKTANKMLMVSHCFDISRCDEKIRGNQIVLYDLKTRKLTWLTSYFTQGKLRVKSSRNHITPIDYMGKTVVRGYPVFGRDEKQIYSLVGLGRVFSLYFHQRHQGDSSLVLLSSDDVEGAQWREELLINHPDQLGHFINAGRISFANNNRLIISADSLTGNGSNNLEKETIDAFFYNAEADRLSIAFDENNSPINQNNLPLNLKTWTTQHSISRDGSRIAFKALGGNSVFLREKDNQKKILDGQGLKANTIGEIHMSGDGKWLVALPSETNSKETDLRYFWRVNTESRLVERLPLREPILKLINETFPSKINKQH